MHEIVESISIKELYSCDQLKFTLKYGNLTIGKKFGKT